MARIYLVEDDENIRRLVLYSLETEGHEASGFETGAEFLETVKHVPADLIILDIMLPDMEGTQILATLRSSPRLSAVPVMMLTAKNSEIDKVTALDTGADDYMTKPFGVMELLSRVRALLRRVERSAPSEKESGILSIGGITLDEERRRVTGDGGEIPLTFKEFELLCYLMHHTGIALSRERILKAVWEFEFEGESRTVDVHIKQLRQKLGAAGNQIKTVRGVGYKIEAR